MKKVKIWSMMMLVAMALPMMVACGDDDEDNGASNYTEAEIVDLLTGKWEVYGELNLTAYNTNETFTDNYKGTIEFNANKSVKFKVTDGTKYSSSYTTSDGQTHTDNFFIEENFIDTYHKYTILKKGGKNYIQFGSSSRGTAFEIVSLTKSTFLLRFDEEITDDNDKSKSLGHVYMTIVSN